MSLKIPSIFLLSMFVVAGNIKESFEVVTLFSTTTHHTTALYMATVKMNSERLTFIRDNIDELQVEIAQGEGEYLNTLAHLYAIENIAEWKNGLQKEYSTIFVMNNIKHVSQLEKHLVVHLKVVDIIGNKTSHIP